MKEGIESSLSKARNKASKPLAKDEFGAHEFDFSHRGEQTQRKFLNPNFTHEMDDESPKIDIFSSRDEGERKPNRYAEMIGEAKSPLT